MNYCTSVYVGECGCRRVVVGGNFLNGCVTGKNVLSYCTLRDTFPFQEKLCSSRVIKMMKNPQDTCERSFSSCIQNLK